MSIKKLAIVLAGLFAFVYVTGIGSTIGEDINAANSNYVTKLNYVTESLGTITHDALFMYCDALKDNSCRFDSGSISKIPYFYGGKTTETNINMITGLDTRFGKWTTGVNSSGEDVFKPYGLDCSGFVAYVHWLAGYKDMPTYGQTSIGSKYDDPINASNGDLLFHFDTYGNINHVGILRIEENGDLYAYEMNAADNGVGLNKINDSIADGNYWEAVYSNPYVD